RRRHTRSKRDWSSDVCSSDLLSGFNLPSNHPLNATALRQDVLAGADVVLALDVIDLFGAFSQSGGIKDRGVFPRYLRPDAKVVQIGRASCRERGEEWGAAGVW